MNPTVSDEYGNLVRYFLGELAEAEQEFVEERYMVDPQYSDLRDEVEMDLVDAYVAGTLTAQQRHHFERHYLITAERKEAVRAAYLTGVYRTSVARTAESPVPLAGTSVPKRRPWSGAFIGALAAALAIAIGGGLWLMYSRRAPKAPVISARNQLPHEMPAADLPKAPTPQPAKTAPAEPQTHFAAPVITEAPKPVTAASEQPAKEGPVITAGNGPQPPPAAGELMRAPSQARTAAPNARDVIGTGSDTNINAPHFDSAPAAEAPPSESYGLSAYSREVIRKRRGQTIDEVLAALGRPRIKARVGTKIIFCYEGLKITFINGRVADI